MIKFLGWSKEAEVLMINPGLNIQWLTHCKDYWQQICANLDGRTNTLNSAAINRSFVHAIDDIRANHKATSHSFLLLLAGKDYIVDNKGAMDFYKNCSTPADKK